MGEERSTHSKNVRRFFKPEPPQLDFPPVRNGIDYLASVVSHLDESESDVDERDLKYAVLHLQAAVEVLFKARLLREHWSLVFENPGEATLEKFREGNFNSCGTTAAVKRLRDIVGIPIDEKELGWLKELAADRNALQHYGLTHNAKAVETRAGRVLDFLMRFLWEHLLPLLKGPERTAASQDMAPVVEGVRNISSYVTRRLNRLRGELKGLENQTVQCPLCEHMALVITPERGTCRFCDESWHPDEMLVFDYLGLFHDDGPRGDVSPCPQCDAMTLVAGVVFLGSPAVLDTLFCFGCMARYTPDELVLCGGCSRPWPLEAEVDGSTTNLCTDCRQQTDPEYIA
ncbi:hypothetical protein ABZ741_21470 [Streptomyces globisporus]|uniref:hypothetical protein n=1 Tax=Streptomyces globisporus TaxID=1908 RepID=UPI003460D8E1